MEKGGGAMDVSERLLAWRKANGLRQVDAAARLGVPHKTYQNWELGRRHPDAGSLRLITLVVDSGKPLGKSRGAGRKKSTGRG